MEQNKSQHKINSRFISALFGLFLMLLAIILFINVGYVARILAFPFFFLFGAGSYLLFALIYIEGTALFFKGKLIRIHSFTKKMSLFFFFIGTSLLLTCICYSVNQEAPTIATSVNEFFSNITPKYLSNKYLNIFTDVRIGTGLLGSILIGLINLIHSALSYAVCSLLIAFSVFLFFAKNFFSFIRKKNGEEKAKDKKEKTPKHLKEKEVKPEPEPSPVMSYHNEPVSSFSAPVIESKKTELVFTEKPSEVTPEPVLPPVSPVRDTPLPVNKTAPAEVKAPVFSISNEDSVLSQANSYQTQGIFKKAHLGADLLEETRTKKVEAPHIQEVSVSKDNGQHEQMNLFEESGSKEEKPEQTLEIPSEETPEPLITPTVISRNVSSPSENEKKISPSPVPPSVSPVNEPSDKEKPAEKIEGVMNDPDHPFDWIAPSLDLLIEYQTAETDEKNKAIAEQRKEIINAAFAEFNVGAHCTSFTVGPSVTRYNIEYDANVYARNVEKMMSEISIKLGGVPARFEKIIAGQSASGIEIANEVTTTVGFKEVFQALPDVKKHPLSVAFGKNISGEIVYADFNEFPHLLVAGTTGSGKSIYLHSIISTLIMRCSPDVLRLAVVDPKQVEMKRYNDLPHLLCPVITEASKAKVMLSKLCDEMNRRYGLLSVAEVSDIKDYNLWAKENHKPTMPFIVAVLDEYADLVDTCKEISQPVVSIAQKARACGIHLLISTQRPSTNVITGVIKGNLPTHVALMTASATDSITIVGQGGAEGLLGKGDMLVQSPLVSRVGMVRLQGCYIQNKEISRIAGYLKDHYKTHFVPEFLDLIDHAKEDGAMAVSSGEYVIRNGEEDEEEKYNSIKDYVMGLDSVSMSKIQRDCGVGFNRAGKIMRRLQDEGIVDTEMISPSRGYRVLVNDKFYDDDDMDEVTSSEQSKFIE